MGVRCGIFTYVLWVRTSSLTVLCPYYCKIVPQKVSITKSLSLRIVLHFSRNFLNIVLSLQDLTLIQYCGFDFSSWPVVLLGDGEQLGDGPSQMTGFWRHVLEGILEPWPILVSLSFTGHRAMINVFCQMLPQ